MIKVAIEGRWPKYNHKAMPLLRSKTKTENIYMLTALPK